MANNAPANVVTYDAGEVFSGKHSGTNVLGWDKATEYTPKVDPNYIFGESSVDMIMWLINSPEPLYIFGPVGAGKTSGIKQLSAKLNYPIYEINGHSHLEYSDLVGHLTVKNGSMSWVDGPLAAAMRLGGIFLINELDTIPAETNAGFNTILDGSPLIIPENNSEIIKPHSMFRIVATANTNGSGDDSGLYQGTTRANGAMLDRWLFIETGYPDANTETSLLLKKCPSLTQELAKGMVSYANEVRKLFTSEDTNAIEVTFSTRSLLRWANLTLRYKPLIRQGKQPLLYALDRALAFRASRETRATLHEIAQRVFGLTPSQAN